MNKTFKKVLIAVAFLGGGIFFIKKILPILSGDVKSFEAPEGDAFEVSLQKDSVPTMQTRRANFLEGVDETNINPHTLEGNQSGGKVPISTVITSGVRTDGNLIL